MARKNSKNHKEELWSRKFNDEKGFTNGNLSRTARRKAKGEVSPIITSLLIFLALLIILPTSTYLWYTSSGKSQEMPPNSESLLVTQNDSSKESMSSEIAESIHSDEAGLQETAEEETASSEASAAQSNTEIAVESETGASQANENVPAEEPINAEEEVEPTVVANPAESPSEDVTATGTYTVQPGDNLFRIALNHGMSTEELKALNGITGDSVNVGVVLKVK